MAKRNSIHERSTAPASTVEKIESGQVAETLRESQERYRVLFDRSLDAVYIHDFEGNFLDANDAALRLLGYSRDEISGLSFADLLDASQLPSAFAALQEITKNGYQANPGVYKLKRKDGTLVEVETVGALITNRGQSVSIQGIARDITERKRAEEALRKAHDELELRAAERTAELRQVNEELRGEIAERKQAEETLRLIVEGTASAVGTQFFRALVKHLAAALEVRYAFIAGLVDPEGERLRLISFWTGAAYGENFEYPTKGTPCEHVVGKRPGYFPTGVQELFPDDPWLREIGIESYLAIPLFDSAGNPLGLLGVMHDDSMNESLPAESVLYIFASRAGAELERKRAEEALQRAREELEGKVERQMVRRNQYRLTFREFTVLHVVAAGEADKGIAHELGISPLTAHKHVANILAKMDAASRTEAGVRAVREGLLD